jgi:hypothetical protein
MSHYLDRYVVERHRSRTNDPHWVSLWDCETLEEAQVKLAESVLLFGGQWRIRDRWNAVKEE